MTSAHRHIGENLRVLVAADGGVAVTFERSAR
jgi:hypothetical protein